MTPLAKRTSTSRRTTPAAVTAALLLGLTLVPQAPASAHEGAGDVATNTRGAKVATSGTGSAMRHVANLQYDRSGENQEGSDIEFMRLGEREFALAGTLRKGLQIIDITDPRKPRRVATYDCAITQGDIQVWTRDGRILASYTADGTVGAAGAASTCGRDLRLGPNDAGTVIVDLTTPSNPKTLSFLPVPRGSHNMTLHPSGRYLYNSNSDLITSTAPTITIYDISHPERPRKVQDFPIPFVPTSLGSESHDITFNASGTRAYSAALSQTLVLDTTDPRNPQIVSQIVDPTVNVSHQADPVTLRRKDGSRRTVLVVTDERAGAAASAECPGGGLHLYDVTGGLEKEPRKIGTWFIPSVKPQDGSTCTSHVLRIYPRQKLLTIAWYAQGVRVLDISALADFEGGSVAVGVGDGVGMREVGHYVMPDSDTWSFKTNKIRRDGSFFGYGNDLVRGFDVYRFDGKPIGSVPALQPVDLQRAAGAQRTQLSWTGSAAIVGPALLVAAALRRVAAGRLRVGRERPR
jgi:hypothetical protein